MRKMETKEQPERNEKLADRNFARNEKLIQGEKKGKKNEEKRK